MNQVKRLAQPSLWFLVFAGTIALYRYTINNLAIQLPDARNIVISNLTLNLVLVLLAVGTLSPYITRKLFPKVPKSMFFMVVTIVAAVLAIGCIFILKMLGMHTRF